MHLIVCWSAPIIFIVTSNHKSYVVKFIVFLTFSYLNYLWLVTHLFVRPIYLILSYISLFLGLFNSLDLLISEKKNVN